MRRVPCSRFRSQALPPSLRWAEAGLYVHKGHQLQARKSVKATLRNLEFLKVAFTNLEQLQSLRHATN